MTGNIISWFDTTINTFEELEKFTYSFEKYYAYPPIYIAIPPEDYFELVRDIRCNCPDVVMQRASNTFMDFEYLGIPIKASDIIRHGVVTDISHKPAYKRWTTYD